MSRRLNSPDTQADLILRENLLAEHPQCFTMVAGAGSGKTTSLIKALSTIIQHHGATFKARRQRLACITYTEIAAEEIKADVGNNPLLHVSTIHSFMWANIRPFQLDIKTWVIRRIDEKLTELRTTAANYGARVQQRTREKNQRDIDRYESEATRISTVKTFSYGTGSDYTNGILGHDDILKISINFLLESRLFRIVFSQQFPFLFVDESQDTTEGIVSALKAVANQTPGQFCLGFFGDPMQKIYMTGIGNIEGEPGWISITKEENFRCPSSVLEVANAIRRTGDGLTQTRGREVLTDGIAQPVIGSARIFILPANDNRDENVTRVRNWIAENNQDLSWRDGSIKTLVIVHRMAARRLGFDNLYTSMNNESPNSFQNGFLDASSWPLKPFISLVIPLCRAINSGKELEAMNLLRKYAPALSQEGLPNTGISTILHNLRIASDQLLTMMHPDSRSTNLEVLNHIRESRLMMLDPRIISYINAPVAVDNVAAPDQADNAEESELEVNSMNRFLNCSASEFWGYMDYIEQQSPFSTQQGIKGAEFERVLVIADDEEGTHFQFSYDKYFGIKDLSERDHQNISEGKETQVDRTRRLFYVCCTRAMKDLAVIYFSQDVLRAIDAIRELAIFPDSQILTEESIN